MTAGHTATIGSQMLQYRIDGTAGAPWLVFSNSLMTDLTLWDGQVEAFGANHRILRYDQRGHGGSSVPEQDCTFDVLVDDLAALLTRLGVTGATVAGVSMGGVTALGLAARHPAIVARVAICDCQPASTPAGATAWEERVAVARAGGMAALADPTIARWFRPATVQAGRPGVARVRTMVAHTPLDGFIRAARALQSYDFRPDLAALALRACPTAFIVGAQDAALPQAMRAMADACPGATFTEIGECGHLPNIEQPAAFNTALTHLLTTPV